MSIASRISKYNRERKYLQFVDKISFDETSKVLDVGFNDVEYSSVDNYLEKKYPYQKNITALGIQGSENFHKNYPLATIILYNGDTFPFENKSFDICWSNAVIEHVGTYEKQLLFIKEMCRVSKKIFFTTPNRLFPIEIHTRTPFLHLISYKLFEKYLILIGKKWATGNYMNLLSKKNIVELLDAANVSNYEIRRNKIVGFTIDFTIIINAD